MYKNILLADDGSASALAAVDEALKLAKSNGAKLHIIYVYHIDPDLDILRTGTREAFKEEGSRVLDKAEKKAAQQGVEVETHLEEGIPDEKIVELASEIEADLVVMGTRGHTGLKKLLIGSVTERVVGQAPCPVLVVRP